MDQYRPVALKVDGLGKSYQKTHKLRPLTIMQAALGGFRRMQSTDTFWAIRNISFELAAGKALGVLGRNGAGKSTLLQLLSGVSAPDEGTISTYGRMGALLDLGAGFHDELTGDENLEIAGLIAGMSKQDIRRRRDQIVEFAELEAIIDSPLRTYSSGSRMRLAFSVAVHNDPKLLLVDEHLSVGDVSFRKKCINRILQLKKDGCAIVFVSQSPEQILEVCETALLLDQGRLALFGEAETVGQQYLERQGEIQAKGPNVLLPTDTSKAIDGLRIELSSTMIDSGAPLTISVDYFVQRRLEKVALSFRIVNADDVIVFDSNTEQTNALSVREPGPGHAELSIDRLDLSAGAYFVSFAAYNGETSELYGYQPSEQPLVINADYKSQGVLTPPLRWLSD